MTSKITEDKILKIFGMWDSRVNYQPRTNVTPRRKLRNWFLISFKTKAFGDQNPPKMERDDPKWIYTDTM